MDFAAALITIWYSPEWIAQIAKNMIIVETNLKYL